MSFLYSQSTDFEVHRNWKAITTSLPIDKWYFDSGSIWTLDYPPLFAYMEYILGMISKLFDKNITVLSNYNYGNWSCKCYQRSTVLIGDILLFFALKKLSTSLKLSNKQSFNFRIAIQLFAGLVYIDNIHFQYNTILFSIFFFSIAYIANEQYLIGALFYTIALCMKHIFIYMAPAYLIFYLKHYIFTKQTTFKDIISKVISCGFVIVLVVLITFFPFIVICLKERSIEQFIQIKNRLFPFQRGLLHTYWAPNAWALYSFGDKVLNYIINKNKGSKYNTSAKGVTQVTEFDYLPNITPNIANGILIGMILVFITKTFIIREKCQMESNEESNKKYKAKQIIKYCLFSNLIFFNFGYQVHEKAFIIISLLSIMYTGIHTSEEEKTKTSNDILNNMCYMIIIIGSLAQMPLIHDYRDYLVKIMLFISYKAFIDTVFIKKPGNSYAYMLFNIFIIVCLLLDFNEIFKSLYNETLMNKCFILKIISKINHKLPFVSLMLFSVLNACFVQIIFIILLFTI